VPGNRYKQGYRPRCGQTFFAERRTGNGAAPSAPETIESNRFYPVVIDITDSEAVRALMLRIKKEQGQMDCLVNNAGLVTYEYMRMATKAAMRDLFEVNVFAAIEAMQYASSLMQKRGAGSIINIASIVAVKGVAGQMAYAASKGAIISATLSAAKELASSGIRVNAVAPGMIETERLKNEMGRFPNMSDSIALGRLGTPEEIAGTCLFLASGMSSYITGQVICADGGLVI